MTEFVKGKGNNYIVKVEHLKPRVDEIVNSMGSVNVAISPIMDEELVITILNRILVFEFLNTIKIDEKYEVVIMYELNDTLYSISISDKLYDTAGGIIFGRIE